MWYRNLNKMKQEKITTSKGEFLVVDSKDAPSSFNSYLRDIEEKLGVQLITGYKLSEITEEGASKIVDELWNGYKNYNSNDNVGNYNRLVKNTAIESLHSLLKSKGIHLFENPYDVYDMSTWHDANEAKQKAEEKTFYNPYIFKL